MDKIDHRNIIIINSNISAAGFLEVHSLNYLLLKIGSPNTTLQDSILTSFKALLFTLLIMYAVQLWNIQINGQLKKT